MRIQNLFLSLIGIFGYCFFGYSQSFQSTFSQLGIDFNHYSIQVTNSGDYVCAGTLFDGPNNNNDLHIIKVDPSGIMMWEQILDLSADDRGLDVMVDPNDDIIVTGYVTPGAIGLPEMYIAKFDPSGVFLGDQQVAQFNASAGTNVIYSSASNSYIVGGFYSDPLSFPLTANEALIVEFDINLNYIDHNQISGTIVENSSINDIVEIPRGYFITGSVGNTVGGSQACMAVILDHNFNITENVSFEYTNWEHSGVSAVFDASVDRIFLMSNNSEYHNPQISIIEDVSATPYISSHYLLELDPTYGWTNAAGFQLKQCSWDPSTLIACGYFRTYADKSSSTNATPWIVQFDSNTGLQTAGYVWPAPSPNFFSHGGGIFSTFQGEHPYIFTQEILTERADGMGYVFVGPREVNGSYGIDLVTTLFMEDTPCFDPISYDNIWMAGNDVAVGPNFTPVITHSTNSAIVMSTHSDFEIFCGDLGERMPNYVGDSGVAQENGANSGIINTIGDEALLNVSPNPFENEFTFELVGENMNGQIIVMNAVGQIVYTSGQISGDYYRGEISLNRYEQGIYFLKFSDGENERIRKIIKM